MKNTTTDKTTTNQLTLTALAAAVCLLLSGGSAASADVTANWSTHCASCHGKDGKAQTKAGRMAGALDLTDAGNQAKFTDEKAFLSIKDGQKDGTKEKMKPFKDKLTDDEIKALIAFVRTLKK